MLLFCIFYLKNPKKISTSISSQINMNHQKKFNIDTNKRCFLSSISIEWSIMWHWRVKTGGMMLKIQICITKINYI